MQYFDRRKIRPPQSLQSPDFDLARHRLADFFERGYERMAQSDFAGELELTQNDAPILDKVRELFHEKCAFCEQKITVHPYRFRPSYKAYPADRGAFPHLYYTWLAHAWENIYAICQDCRPSDPSYFPVKGRRCPLPELHDIQEYADSRHGLWGAYPPNESPMLLDPCVNIQFERHFHVLSSGELVSTSSKAHTTIEHFSLNRPELVTRRQKVFESYLALVLKQNSSSSQNPRELFNFSDCEFGGAWYLLLRRCLQATDPTLPIGRAGIVRSLVKLLADRDKRIRFEFALNASPADQPIEAYRPIPERKIVPHLRSIEIQNFKSIERLAIEAPSNGSAVDIETSPPALLLLGENATGKSSVLEAITLTCMGEGGIEDLKLQPDDLVLKAGWLGAADDRQSREAKVRLYFVDGSQRYLTIGPRGAQAPPDQALAFAYGAFRRYENVDGKVEFERAKHQASLFYSRHALPNPDAWLARLHGKDGTPRFFMVTRVLNRLFGVEDDAFRMIRVINGRCFIAMAEDAAAEFLALTPLDAASSGFRSVLGMVCDICAGLMDPAINPDFDQLDTAQAIVLIDEIEAHLHPRWKMQVMSGLRKALPHVTFIVTSHEPLCLRGMNSGEIGVLYRSTYQSPNGSMVRVALADQLPDFQRMTIEQILTSDFFSLFTTDAIEIERKFAQMADLMARRDGRDPSLTATDLDALHAFEQDIASALPVGSSHAQRLVQRAVADNLALRRKVDPDKQRRLDSDTVARIRDILGQI